MTKNRDYTLPCNCLHNCSSYLSITPRNWVLNNGQSPKCTRTMRIVQHTYITLLDMDRLIHFGRMAMTVSKGYQILLSPSSPKLIDNSIEINRSLMESLRGVNSIKIWIIFRRWQSKCEDVKASMVRRILHTKHMSRVYCSVQLLFPQQ